MKKLNYLILLILFGCGPSIDAPIQTAFPQGVVSRDIEIYIIDSCEYIGDLNSGKSWDIITHKGNCKFCKERNKK